jgi:glycosyltransferase involved in cell wall biosynthesis
MKIGIDVRCLMQNNYSGVSWYTYNLLLSIFKLDKSNEYILFYNNSKPIDMPRFDGDNIKYAGFNYSNKIFSLGLQTLSKPEIDKMIGGVDVFFMPNINFAAFSSKCKRVITVHDLSYLKYPQFWTFKSKIWHKILLNKKIIQNADKIIAVSKNTKMDLINILGINEDKIQTVYEGVDSKFKPISNKTEIERVKKRYKLPHKFILYIGTLEPRKNIESIIDAYNKLNINQDLIIAGSIGWKADQIKKLAQKNSKIKLIGYIGEEDKRGLYSLADLLVYPSYYEGFGLPLLESMACGTPIIAGSNSSQVEVVEKSGLLIDPYNVNELAQAMKFILEKDTLKNELIISGLERVKNFSWERSAEKTLNLFKNI